MRKFCEILYFLYFSERSIKEEDDNIQTKVHVSETVLKADPNHDPNHEHDLDLTASFLNTDSNTKTKERFHIEINFYLLYFYFSGLKRTKIVFLSDRSTPYKDDNDRSTPCKDDNDRSTPCKDDNA